MTFENYLYETIQSIMEKWDDEKIYAISFLVYAPYFDTTEIAANVPEFSIGYNTEEDCNYAGAKSEERWNYAYWCRNNTLIIDPYTDDKCIELLLNWYDDIGVKNIGFEDEDEDALYDKDMNYIGKGPNGYYELLCLISNIAGRLQKNGIIEAKFGKIPIIVHDLDYSWYVEEATKNANPNGEAETFLRALKSGFAE